MGEGDGSPGGLERADLDPDPIRQLLAWLDEARRLDPEHATDMVLATADDRGAPSVRWVLLRGIDHGLVFYTNLRSRKARELDANPRAAVALYWPRSGRQVRAEGPVERLAPEEAARYFATRPRGHQLAAWASPQGRVLTDRAELERRYREAEARFEGREVPLPPFWGGLRLTPVTAEFWESRDNRLHDRLRYVREEDGWRIERLAP